MTDQEINETIAIACGWKDIGYRGIEGLPLKTYFAGHPPEGSEAQLMGDFWIVPNYCEDLNAMHEAEKILTDEQQNYYAWLLVMSVDNYMTWKPEEFPTIEVWEFGLTETWFATHVDALKKANAFIVAIRTIKQ